MEGNFYLQKEVDGYLIEKPIKMSGTISVINKELCVFNCQNWLLVKMDVLDFIISADGILFKGVEDLNGRKLYQELWFVPKR